MKNLTELTPEQASEMGKMWLSSMTMEEVREAFEMDELLESFKPEELLERFEPEERMEGLSTDVIKAYLREKEQKR